MQGHKTIVQREPLKSTKPVLAELHPKLQSIYFSRNIESPDQLDYSFSRLPQPGQLLGMDAMVEYLADAMQHQLNMIIVADFDADGATSCAVAKLGLESMGAERVSYVIPDRFKFGYGLTPEIVDVALQYKPDILITVDNGINSIDGVIHAQRHGIKVLITDHHLPGEQLPPAEAIVNPNQPDCSFPSGNLAGVGVMFYVLLGLRKFLRDNNWFQDKQIPEPNLAQLLDLVALGTVADVVSLDFINRLFVKQGLSRINTGKTRPGIQALIELKKRDVTTVSASDLGFVIAPRLNAAGRLEDMSVGVQCLLSDDLDTARLLSVKLDKLNEERRAIEQSMRIEASESLQQIDQIQDESQQQAICMYHCNWHQGVIGILASRIKDDRHKPVILFADTDDGLLKGSGRSISGVHLRDVLTDIAVGYPQLMQKFGGHAMAVGLTIEKVKLEQFQAAFDEMVGRRIGNKPSKPVIYSDGRLKTVDISLAFAGLLEQSGPWGQGFPEPVFNGIFDIIEIRILHEKHVKLLLAVPDSELFVEAIAFNVNQAREWMVYQQIEIVYRLQINRFRNQETVQLVIEYLHSAVTRSFEQNNSVHCPT